MKAIFCSIALAAAALGGCGLFDGSDRQADSASVSREGRSEAAPGPRAEDFYPTSRPFTRWWWFAAEIDVRDVEAQLDWLKANGFGGVEIAWIYPVGRDPDAARIPWISAEWSRAVAHTKRYADSIGLGVDFTFGTLWPFGASFVSDADRTQVFGDPDFKQDLRLSWEHPVIGNVIDHMDAGAFERYAAVMGAALEDALAGSRSSLFCDSWEVESRRLWTDGFGEAFEQRFGYDLRPFMPDIYAPERAAERYDYMKLVSEYVIDGFFQPFAETCRRLGAFSRVQCAGAPADLIDAYAAVDVPESEAMLYEPRFAKIPASAAALAGRPVVSSETFTCLYGFPGEHLNAERVMDLKLVADALFANGVNHIIWHGMPYNRIGEGRNRFYATVHVGEEGALAPELPGFNRYMEKVAGVMRRGRIYSDAAVYLPLEDAWIAGEYPPELQMKWSWGAYELRYIEMPAELRGHHPLWINGSFLKSGVLRDGELCCGGARFSCLYIDVDHMDGESLDTILDLAEKGFPVCLKRRPREPGRVKSGTYADRLDRLEALPNVSADFAAVARTLPLVEGDDLPDYWCRAEGGRLFIFFAHPQARDLRLPIPYGLSDQAARVEKKIVLSAGGRRFETTLVFEPNQSLLVEAGEDGVSLIDVRYAPAEAGGAHSGAAK